MAKAREGMPLNGLPASEWNRHVDVADWYFRTKQLGEGVQQAAVSLSVGQILVKNSSSADRRRGEILKVGDYLLTGLTHPDPQYPWFDAALHDGTDAPFAVLLDPLPNGEIGPAQIAGACMALVNFADANQRYARPASSNDVLQGDALGQVHVLYKPSGTGEKECMVDLSQGRYQAHGKADAAISKGSSGTVSIWTGAGGSESDGGLNVTAYARGVAITSGKIVQVALMNNVIYVGCWEA